jgi:hypothetical protein
VEPAVSPVMPHNARFSGVAERPVGNNASPRCNFRQMNEVDRGPAIGGCRNSPVRRPGRHFQPDQFSALKASANPALISLTHRPISGILKSLRGVASAGLCGFSSGPGLEY